MKLRSRWLLYTASIGSLAILVAPVAKALTLPTLLHRQAAPAAPPSPVRHLVAATLGTRAKISWIAPRVGTVARYEVSAFVGAGDGTPFGTRVTSATSLLWDGLPLNQPAHFTVKAIGPDGANGTSGGVGPLNVTGSLLPANALCPANSSGDCVVVDTGTLQGPETWLGAGVLHGTVPAGNPYASRLHLHLWRISAGDSNEYQRAVKYVPASNVLEVLSDAWYTATARKAYGSNQVADPWADWLRYSAFISGIVRQAVIHHIHPYWEIQNEPEVYPYSHALPATRALVERQYLIAYRAIKSVDPSARIVGPSSAWVYEDPRYLIDFKTFIPYAAANGMRFSVLAWHDNGASLMSDPLYYAETPRAIRDEARDVKELIAENPAIGSPALFIDENTSAAGAFSPGWAASYLAEEEQAGIAAAGRSCWPYPGQADGCFGPTMGNLMNEDGVPSASFWSMADYSSLSGNKVATESTDSNISSLAVRGASGVTRVLLGRHQTCSGWTATSRYCTETIQPAAVPVTLKVLLPTAATSAVVGIQGIADTRADMPNAPRTVWSTVSSVAGVATVTIPAVADGAAYFVSVAPNNTLGVTPRNGNVSSGETPAASGIPARTRVVSEPPQQQTGVPGFQLTYPLTALVTDQYGDPIAGERVSFLIPSGGIFATANNVATVLSNADGLAVSPKIVAGAPGTHVPLAFFNALGVGPGRPAGYFIFSVR